MKWFTMSWWGYLLGPRNNDIGIIRTAICRAKGHPAGVWYYDPLGTEPDMHCINCNDDLG